MQTRSALTSVQIQKKTVAHLEIRRGYISGVHFQRCSNFGIIFFTLKLVHFFISKEGGGAAPLNTPMENTRYKSIYLKTKTQKQYTLKIITLGKVKSDKLSFKGRYTFVIDVIKP